MIAMRVLVLQYQSLESSPMDHPGTCLHPKANGLALRCSGPGAIHSQVVRGQQPRAIGLALRCSGPGEIASSPVIPMHVLSELRLHASQGLPLRSLAMNAASPRAGHGT